MATPTSALEAVLRRDRVVVIAALVLVIALSWIYILLGAGMGMSAFEMTASPFGGGADMSVDMGSADPGDSGAGMTMEQPGSGMAAGGSDAASQGSGMAMDDGMVMAMAPIAWTLGYAVLMFFMWWIMMVAMMLPSAAPMILLFARFNRTQRDRGAPYVPTGAFALGYLVVWAAFSLVAVSAQWGLERTGLLSSMMASTSVILGAGLLIAAGIYQLTPLKYACLRHCRSPLFFISHHWRPGEWGALRMGLEHGAFCAGCCWFLMALLFYGGVMNLFWIIGLALFVLLEKVAPAGHWVGWIMGIGLIAWGGALLLLLA
jgi:predicted metal-binding membrane protein